MKETLMSTALNLGTVKIIAFNDLEVKNCKITC